MPSASPLAAISNNAGVTTSFWRLQRTEQQAQLSLGAANRIGQPIGLVVSYLFT